jgi:hypothetical protein
MAIGLTIGRKCVREREAIAQLFADLKSEIANCRRAIGVRPAARHGIKERGQGRKREGMRIKPVDSASEVSGRRRDREALSHLVEEQI